MMRGNVLGVQEMLAAFGQFPSLLRQAGMGAMTESLVYLSKVIRDEYLMGPYPTEIERRSGSFRATFARGHPSNIFTVQAVGTQILGTFGSTDKRGRILNDGGVIRSTRPGGFLAVRTEFTKTPRGVVRDKYQQPLRNLPNTFVVMGGPKGGRQARGTVFEKFGKRIVPIAWLVKYVVIVGRKFMQKGEAKATPGIQTIVQQTFDTMTTQLNQTLQKVGLRR
jgi:hypothetical protein